MDTNCQAEATFYDESLNRANLYVVQDNYSIYLLTLYFVFSSSTSPYLFPHFFSSSSVSGQQKCVFSDWHGYCKSDHPSHFPPNNRHILSLYRSCWAEEYTYAVLMYLWQRCRILCLWWCSKLIFQLYLIEVLCFAYFFMCVTGLRPERNMDCCDSWQVITVYYMHNKINENFKEAVQSGQLLSWSCFMWYYFLKYC